MSNLQDRVRQKRAAFMARDIEKKRENINEAFRNEDGAIDLASIMVGIIVIGLIGGVIAATVFAVIPWSQDNAAKHQLDSIVAAQSAYMGLSSDSPPALPSGHKANSFADSASLASASLLQTGSTYCAVITDNGKGYLGLSQSSSGKVWSATDKKTKPTNLGIGSIAPDCSFTSDPAGNNESGTETPYVDPTPTTTTLTYKCDVEKTGKMPMQTTLNGKESWSRTDGVPVTTPTTTHSGVTSLGSSKTLAANIEYKVTFEGTYKAFSSQTTGLNACLRSVDHWGVDTGVTSVNAAFYGATNLTEVPEHIPSNINSMDFMFYGASSFNDSVDKWDVSSVTTMNAMFNGATSFNKPLNSWKTTSLQSTTGMFSSAINFDQPLDSWDVTKVDNMNSMFSSARKFNQPLDKWDVRNVTKMDSMFLGATLFDQNLSGWNVDKVTMHLSFARSTPIEAKTEYLPKF